MADPGRNDPCPCGSGKKFKQCCLLSAQLSPLARAKRLHSMDHRLVMDVIAFAVRTLDLDPFAILPFEFDPTSAEDEAFAPLAFSVAAFHDDIEEEPLAAQFAEHHAKQLTQSERDWIHKQCETRLSVYEVIAVRPGESLTVADVLAGGEYEISERLASQSARVHQHLLMRVIVHDDLTLMCGLHPVPLGPLDALALIKEVKRVTGVRSKRFPLAKLVLADVQLELLAIWHETACAPVQMPKLTNTDGDELLPTVDKYRFERTALAPVLEALFKIPGMSYLEGEPEPGEPYTLSWSKPGKAMESVSVAFLSVRAGRMDVETNSIARADAAKAAVLSGAGSLVRFFGRAHSDMESMLREQAGKPLAPQTPPTDEMIAALGQLKDAHYRSWIDEEIPALGHLTPRKAVVSAKGKAQVIALLKELEWREASLPANERYDMAWMWSALGLKQ